MVQHTRGSADWFRHCKRDLIEHAKAFDAFSAAFRSFETLSKLPADVDVEIRSALLSSAVVSYGRPFKESRDLQRRPLPRLDKNLIKRQSGFDDEIDEELIDLRDKIVAHSDAAYVDARVLVKRLTNFTFERKKAVDDPVLGAVVMMNAVHILTDQNLAARMQAHVQSAAEAMIPLVEDELEDYARAANEFPGIFRTVHSEGTLGRSFNEETVVIPVNAGTVHLPRTVPDPFQVLSRPPLQLRGDGYDYRSTGIGVDLIGSAAVKLDDGSEITILVEQNLSEPTDPSPSD